MTEMSPLGTLNSLKAGMQEWAAEDILRLQTKAGRGIYGVELRIVDDEQNELPWDGKAYGALQVRGPWICSDTSSSTAAGAHCGRLVRHRRRRNNRRCRIRGSTDRPGRHQVRGNGSVR
jgi:acyl-CoA synthetase (AMP-forming)/AMP-acid ligase II